MFATKTCSNQELTIYGTTCKFDCYAGYVRKSSTSSSVTCNQHGQWIYDGTKTECERIQCNAKPEAPPRGFYYCSDPLFHYQSSCWLDCEEGFQPSVPTMAECQADGTWALSNVPTCKDIQPPVFVNCKTEQIFYADANSVVASGVIWEEPTATDNVDGEVSVVKVHGPDLGADLDEGDTVVIYNVEDTSGNKQPTSCMITLTVKILKCLHPSAEFALNDEFMAFECNHTYYGGSCKVSCRFYSSLEGSDTVKCAKDDSVTPVVGVWEWGQNGQNETRPICKPRYCPELSPPQNGLIACDTVGGRPYCLMQCQESYDIPFMDSTFSGSFVCSDSGLWLPYSLVPNCTEDYNDLWMRLPSELFYYSGNCADNATQEQIKKNFEELMLKYQPAYECPEGASCGGSNVKITCGPVTGRRRKRSNRRDVRQTHAYIIEFYGVVHFDQGNMTTGDAYNNYKAILESKAAALADDVAAGLFNIPGLTIAEDSFQFAETPEVECGNNKIREGLDCKSCPSATYYKQEENKCDPCPIGTYQEGDGGLSCEMCPEGFSTSEDGQDSITACKEICFAGSFATDRVEPCSLCPTGFYQPEAGSTSCISCPPGQTTTSEGMKSQLSCKNFDIITNSTIKDAELKLITQEMDNITLQFWLKSSGHNDPYIKFYFTRQDIGEYLTLILEETVTLLSRFGNYRTNVSVPRDSWVHFAMNIEKKNRTFKLYMGNELSYEATLNGSDSDVIVANTAVKVTVLDRTELQLSALSLTTILDLGVQPSPTTCANSLQTVMVSLSDFLKKAAVRMELVVPSACDAVNECANKPCGNHTCLNEIGQFTCRCHGGYSGNTCEIPPDYCIDNNCTNGATCQNGQSGYSCYCQLGYTGAFCEISPVDGGWSDWQPWSQCSKTCHGGKRERNRYCDNPSPGLNGKPCAGISKEVSNCNTKSCPECKRLSRSKGTFLRCVDEEDIRICNLTCVPGKIFAPGSGGGTLLQFNCGRSTNYEWTNINVNKTANSRLPSCSDVHPPKDIEMDGEFTYDDFPCGDQKGGLDLIKDNLEDLFCRRHGLCEIEDKIEGCGELIREKRSSDNGAAVKLRIMFPLVETGELDIAAALENKTVTPRLLELVNAIVSLELSGQDLMENASSLLSFTYGGKDFSVKNESLALYSIVTCPSGSVPQDGMCTECPEGTMQNGSSCIFCEVGTYQDLPAQTNCKVCPSDFSTNGIGATSVEECTEALDGPSEGTDKTDTDQPKGLIMIIAVTVSVVAVVAFVIILSVLIAIKHNRSVKGRQLTGSLFSLNQVAPEVARPKLNIEEWKAPLSAN